jgi:glucokinase
VRRNEVRCSARGGAAGRSLTTAAAWKFNTLAGAAPGIDNMLLVGDIGGTKTVLSAYVHSADGLKSVREEVYPSGAHRSLEEIMRKFLDAGEGESYEAWCFGVAGPVREGKCRVTNVPWVMDEPSLTAACGARRGKLLNDLEAMAYGMLFVPSDKFEVLNPGTECKGGHAAIVAAGTGLGEAFLCWDGEKYHPMASEGGHADFAPRNEVEFGLWEFLSDLHGPHVSYERILSGNGFHDVFTYLRRTGKYAESPELAKRLAAESANPVISELGLSKACPLCVATLELFCEIYGAEAGNCALKCVGLGGVFIGGGIGPKLRSVMTGGAFMRGFLDKGRFAGHLKNIPVRMSLDTRTPLLGAANYALRLALL